MKTYNVYQFGVKPNSNEEYNEIIGTVVSENKEQAIENVACNSWKDYDKKEFMKGYLSAHEITIDWEFIGWAEKKENLATIQGICINKHLYKATGVMGGGEVVEVMDIEIVK